MQFGANQFVDIDNLPKDVVHWFVFWLLGKGLESVIKKSGLIKSSNLSKKFGWFQIGCLAISFIFLGYLSSGFRKIRLQPISDRIDKCLFIIFKQGFFVFGKIEPDLATILKQKINEWISKNNTQN